MAHACRMNSFTVHRRYSAGTADHRQAALINADLERKQPGPRPSGAGGSGDAPPPTAPSGTAELPDDVAPPAAAGTVGRPARWPTPLFWLISLQCTSPLKAKGRAARVRARAVAVAVVVVGDLPRGSAGRRVVGGRT